MVTLGRVAVALMVVMSWVARAPSDAEARPNRPDVVIIGDSLTVGSARALRSRLTDAGLNVTVDAAVSRHVGEGFPDPFSGIRAERRVLSPSSPDTIVLAALGTNDLDPNATEATIRASVAAFVASASGRSVCWLALHVRADHRLAAVAERANGWYERAITELGGCWLTWTPDPAEWGADGIHLSAGGYQRRATQIADQLIARIAARPATASPPVASLGVPSGVDTATPVRLVDTRAGQRLVPDTDRRVPITLPPGATGVLVGVTMTDAPKDGWLSAWGCGAWPGTSSVNAARGSSRASTALITVDPADPAICLRSGVAAHAIVDLLGTLSPAGQPLSLVTSRLYDSRPARVSPLTPVRVTLGQTAATAAIVTLTSLGGPAGYATAGRCDARPDISNLNFDGPDPIAATSLVPVGDAAFCVWTSTAVGLLIDLVAVAEPAGDALLEPTVPTRVVDTRLGLGATWVTPQQPVRTNGTIIATVTHVGGPAAGYFSPSCAGTTSMENWGPNSAPIAAFGVLVDCLATSAPADVVIDEVARLVPVQS